MSKKRDELVDKLEEEVFNTKKEKFVEEVDSAISELKNILIEHTGEKQVVEEIFNGFTSDYFLLLFKQELTEKAMEELLKDVQKKEKEDEEEDSLKDMLRRIDDIRPDTYPYVPDDNPYGPYDVTWDDQTMSVDICDEGAFVTLIG